MNRSGAPSLPKTSDEEVQLQDSPPSPLKLGTKWIKKKKKNKKPSPEAFFQEAERESRYDVFLSFSGKDIRDSFTDYLYHVLDQKGISTFLDDGEREGGDSLAPDVIKAIEESKFVIVIVSSNYAGSSWCLDGLAKAIDYHKVMAKKVFPVFYDVKPSEVGPFLTGKFGKAFSKHTNAIGDPERAQKWADALAHLRILPSWVLEDRAEVEVISEITEAVFSELKPISRDVKHASGLPLSKEVFKHARGLCRLPLSKEVVKHARGLPVSHLLPLVIPIMHSSHINRLWKGVNVKIKSFLFACLTLINLRDSNLTEIPDFTGVPKLEQLVLEGCTSLVSLHPSIGILKKLALLNLKYCISVQRLPPLRLESFELLIASGCSKMKEFPEIVENMECLSELHLDGTALVEIPESIGRLTGLSLLNLEGCKGLRSLPSVISSITSLKSINVTGCSNLRLDISSPRSLECLEERNISGSNDRRKLMYPLLQKLDFSYQVVPSFSSVIHLSLKSDSVTSVYATESLPLTYRIEEIVNPDEETQGKQAEWVSSELHSPIVMVQDETEIETRNVVSEVDKSSSEHLERLVLYCSLFPEDFEFRKLELVQLWIAEGLDMKESDQETMEDAGIKHFNTLEGQGFLMHSRCDFTVGFDSVFSVPMYSPGDFFYKVNPVQLSVLDAKSSAANYFKAMESKLEGASESTTQHLSFTYDDIDDVTFGVIPKFKNLRSLLLLCRRGGTIRRIPGDFFLSLNFLTTLKLSRTLISELPGSIGNVKALRYLDVSYTPIMRLPESIGSLEKLQTLILRGCMHLCDLPRSTHRLTALRHLDFDIIGQLDFMPAHLGNLTDLQTLSAFLVDQDDGRFIRELKNLNDLRGGIRLLRLENVLSKADAEAADLPSKKALMRLDLQWTSLMVENVKLQEEILDSLRPHAGLRELQILFYNGTKLPAWLSRPSFTGLVVMTLYKCDNCELLPSIGQLPELKFLCIVEMNKVTEIDQTFFRSHNDPIVEPFNAFPKLEILELDIMLHLNEWKEIKEGDMPSLIKLTMESCPELVILPSFSRLKCLKYLEVKHCQKLMSLDRNGLPSSLDSLIIRDCPGLEEWSDMEGDQQFGPRAELC